MDSVDTIAGLRTYDPPTPPGPTAVLVLGAVDAGDGGGGVFVWAAGDRSPDDTGIVIRSTVLVVDGCWRRAGFLDRTRTIPLRGDPRPMAGAVTEAWESNGEPINVKWFGAVGDGVTPDDEKIQAAVDAALRLRPQEVFDFHPLPGGAPSGPQKIFPETRFNGPSVFFPTGTYALSKTVDVPAGISLIGEPMAEITATRDQLGAIPLLRIACAFNDIEALTFVGGLHSIALFRASNEHGHFLPGVNNYPCRIRHCTFHYPKGPAIWQDAEPGLALDGGGNEQLHRTFTTPLIVTDFSFTGPHLFWGTGDVVIFQNGIVRWDQVNVDPEFTEDAFEVPLDTPLPEHCPADPRGGSQRFPLACITSGNNLLVDNCFFYPVGSATGRPGWDCAPLRKALIVGTGNISITNSSTTDITHQVFVRTKVTGNDYQGAASRPVSLPAERDPRTFELRPEVRLALTIHNTSLEISAGVNWLEIYERFPRLISVDTLRSHNPPYNFPSSHGIWVYADPALREDELLPGMVDLPATLGRHKYTQVIRLDGFTTLDGLRIRASDERHINRRSGPGVRDLTAHFTPFFDQPTQPAGETIGQENLFFPGIYNAGSGPDALPAGPVDPTHRFLDEDPDTDLTLRHDTTMGYALRKWWPAQDDTQFHFLTGAWPGASRTKVAAGVYVFSFFVKADFLGQMVLAYRLDGLGDYHQVATRRFGASGSFERVWFPFFYPGSGSVDIECHIGHIDRHTELSLGFFCIHRGMVPAPYRFPVAVTYPPRVDDDDGARPVVTSFTPTSIYYSPRAPASGNYVRGDIVYNSAPAEGQPLGWVCIVGGDPAKFRPFARIED